jgi:hypothetical protein
MRHLCHGYRVVGRGHSGLRVPRSCVSLVLVVAGLASGCSEADETRVQVVPEPDESGAETQSEGRLEPGSAQAPDDSPTAPGQGGSAGAGTTDSGPGGEPTVPSYGPTQTDNRSRPWIDDLSDRRVFRGESVLLSGGLLLPNPSVLLGGRVIAPLDASPTSLKFVVPADLELTRCEVTFGVLVKTDNGISPSTELAVLERPPEIAVLEPRVRAGQSIAPRVEPKDTGTIELEVSGRAPVRLALSPEGSLTIPVNTPEGPAVLRWKTPCGEAVAAIDVQLPAP